MEKGSFFVIKKFDKILLSTDMTFTIHLTNRVGKQDGRVIKTPAFGSEGLKFDPRLQLFVQLS